MPENLTESDEVALVSLNSSLRPQDIQIYFKDGGVQRINPLNASYDALHYTLLFPYGDNSWHPKMTNLKGAKLTAAEYYRYLFNVFDPRTQFNGILRSGKLMAEFACASWFKIEKCRLDYQRHHQKELKAERYQGLLDALNAEEDPTRVGQKIILAPSHTGSPRWYQSKFQDSMAIVRKYGKPHLFLTFTASGKWEDTKASIFEGQDTTKRPDIVVRIFNEKLEEFKKDILKRKVFGRVLAHSYVIEFQKRGLPHVHFVLWLHEQDSPKKPEDIDRFISAEIPDKAEDPILHDLVKTHMVHGPCRGLVPPHSNAQKRPPCMNEKGECEKNYPKDFTHHTLFGDCVQPLYRRRSPGNGGRTVEVYSKHTKKNHTLDNRWIVPYNRQDAF